jgi:hypothetical protein
MSSIIGDLLEEYREVVLPERGRLRAALWFGAQLASLVRPWMWGTVMGLVFGTWNLVGTVLYPLADDTPLVMLSLVTFLLVSWALVGFSAVRRTSRIRDAMLGGAIAATISTTLFGIANFVRVTVFLDVIKDRADWVGLIARFNASGSTDLRAFVVSEYSTSIPATIIVLGVVGALMGGLGGLIGCGQRRVRA